MTYYSVISNPKDEKSHHFILNSEECSYVELRLSQCFIGIECSIIVMESSFDQTYEQKNIRFGIGWSSISFVE